MKWTLGATLILLATALAGCAEEPVPEYVPSGTDALDAYAILQSEPPVPDATLLGFFAHDAPASRIPWPIGPVSTYEHMHLSSGKNPSMDQGTANAWYSLHYARGDDPKIALTTVAGSTEVQRTFDAEHFGWRLEWPGDTTAETSGGDRAAHGGHACSIGSFTDDWNVGSQDAWATAHAAPDFAAFRDANQGETLMLYLPRLFMHGDDCTRSTPLGFDFLPQTNVWAVFWSDLDIFLGGGIFGPSVVALIDADTGDLLDVTTFEGTWGTQARSSGTHAYHSDLPGLPVLPQTYEVPFSVPEGSTGLEVAARVLSGPEVYEDPTITLTGPGFEESQVDLADWSLDAPDAGAWTVTFTVGQAQPLADYTFDVNALTY